MFYDQRIDEYLSSRHRLSFAEQYWALDLSHCLFASGSSAVQVHQMRLIIGSLVQKFGWLSVINDLEYRHFWERCFVALAKGILGDFQSQCVKRYILRTQSDLADCCKDPWDHLIGREDL